MTRGRGDLDTDKSDDVIYEQPLKLDNVVYLVQEADIDEMFDFADADSDGRLSFREFEVVVDVNVMHLIILENYENKSKQQTAAGEIYYCL